MATSYGPIARRISELKANQKRIQEQMKVLRSVKTLVRPLVRPLMSAKKAGLLRWDPSVETSGNSDHFTVEIYGYAPDIEGFKDKRLTRVLSKYLEADASRTQDYAESLTREFHFEFRRSEWLTIKVRIVAQAKSDNATCQKVLKSVSTKVVEVKEYEIVCNS